MRCKPINFRRASIVIRAEYHDFIKQLYQDRLITMKQIFDEALGEHLIKRYNYASIAQDASEPSDPLVEKKDAI